MMGMPGLSKEVIDEKLEKATQHRLKGNDHFVANEYKKALYEYHYAINFCRGLTSRGTSPTQTSTCNEIVVKCNNNMAAVHLKNDNADRAIKCLKEVLDLEEKNVKANFRMGKAYLLNKDTQNAEKFLRIAKNLNPRDANINTAIKELKKLQAEEDKKASGFYASMFSNNGSGKKSSNDKTKSSLPDGTKPSPSSVSLKSNVEIEADEESDSESVEQ